MEVANVWGDNNAHKRRLHELPQISCIYYITNSTDTILEITPLKCKEITPVFGVMVSPGNSTHARGIRAKVKVVRLSPKEASVVGSGGMLPRKILCFEMLFGGILSCNTV